MKKFVFELEKVLEFRSFEQQEAEGQLAKALAVENEIQNNLNQIASQMLANKNRVKGSQSFDDIISSRQFETLLEYQKEELLNQLSQAKFVSEEKREILRQCMQKTSALEKLKEQQLEEYKAAADYEESEFADDLATMRQSN